MNCETRLSSVFLSPWNKPPSRLTLERKTVHLWRFHLWQKVLTTDLLSAKERQRAQRLRIPQKARDFTVARTRLRQILGGYLNIPPQDVCITCNANGKPILDDASGPLLAFNLSHSGEWGLCAVTHDYAVGVDLEAINSELVFEPLAENFFSSSELRWWRSCSEARLRRRFYRLWTRKEAWLKCKGGGFSESEQELEPALCTTTAARGGGWWVMNFPVTRGYVGAVAVAGDVERIERWDWRAL